MRPWYLVPSLVAYRSWNLPWQCWGFLCTVLSLITWSLRAYVNFIFLTWESWIESRILIFYLGISYTKFLGQRSGKKSADGMLLSLLKLWATRAAAFWGTEHVSVEWKAWVLIHKLPPNSPHPALLMNPPALLSSFECDRLSVASEKWIFKHWSKVAGGVYRIIPHKRAKI